MKLRGDTNPAITGDPHWVRDNKGYLALAILATTERQQMQVALQPMPYRGPQGGEQSKRQHNPCCLEAPMWGDIKMNA